MIDIILSGRLGREILELHSSLRSILVDSVLPRWPVKELVVTCIYRSPEEDQALAASGIHAAGPPYRAIDIRIRNLDTDPIIAQSLADTLATVVNSEWSYDNSRPHLKVAVAKQHGSGPHLHLQCFPGRTTRAEND